MGTAQFLFAPENLFFGAFLFFLLLRSRKRASNAFVSSYLQEPPSKLVAFFVAPLAKKMGAPMPHCVLDESVPTAMCGQHFGKKKTLVLINPELLKSLTPFEIRAVVAHELSHLHSHDLSRASVLHSVADATTIIASIIVPGQITASLPQPMPIFLLLSIFLCFMLITLFAVSYTLTLTILLPYSRHREYRADQTAVVLFGCDPEVVASALLELTALQMRLRGFAERGPSFLRTHPPVIKRTAALLALKSKAKL